MIILNMNYDVIEIMSDTIYEHRHLLTDDFQYNSLIISNIINQNSMLLGHKK